jgi:hypothetical protein
LSTARAVQERVEALDGWISELGDNFDEDLDRVVPFDYSPELEAAMDLHGLTDPDAAWSVFSERAEALRNVLSRF